MTVSIIMIMVVLLAPEQQLVFRRCKVPRLADGTTYQPGVCDHRRHEGAVITTDATPTSTPAYATYGACKDVSSVSCAVG